MSRFRSFALESFLIYALSIPPMILPASAAEKVVLQLCSDHQFQFAGYYAAKWKGYYDEAGLDVEFRSAIGPDKQIHGAVKEVSEGRADFGVGSADIIIARELPRESAVEDLQAFNRFQAGEVAKLMLHPVVQLGHINSNRWGKMHEAIKDAGMITGNFDPLTFIFDPVRQRREANERLIFVIKIVLAGVVALLIVSSTWTFILRRSVARRTAEHRESEERFRDIAQTSSDWFWEMGPDLRFTYHSDRYFEITGFCPEDKIGTSRTHYVDPSDLESDSEKWAAHFEDMEARRSFKNFEYEFKTHDGRIIYARINGTPIFDVEGKFLGYRGTGTDITERKRAQERLRESEEKFRAVVDHSSAAIVFKDTEGRYLIVNKQWETWFNQGAREVIGKTVHDFFPRQDADAITAHDRRVLDGLEPEERVYNFTYPDGITRDILCQKFPVIGADGRPLGVGSIATDITERKKTEHELLEAYEELEARIEHRTRDLRQEISERKRVEEARRAAMEQAEAANRAKSEFLSSMSHELRTPLNAILGFGQLLEQNPKDPLTDSQLEHTRQILKGGRHLLELINEVLELARIESGKVTLAKENVRPGKIFAESLDLTRTFADEAGIELKDRTHDLDLPLVRCDPTRFKQVLINLLSNAVKYNREGGRVTLACREMDDGMLRVEVIDTGPGIPAEMQGELFQPFCRLGKETTDVEGTGIGLTITKQLVHLMEGRIDVESELGKGSTFWFELPLAGESAPGTDADEAHEPPPSARTYRFLDQPFNLLYVEDNRANQDLMVVLFARYPNVNLFTAQTAEEGLKFAAANRPDMIIMDINLPGLSGIEALGKLRRSKKTRAIPVIALSASALPREIKRGLEAGFLSYLTKPIVIDEVLNAIDDVLVDA
ncbi:MAG: PAS domain S-box protein [Proteobacteria bacterium]|nr:PAS domain S-box protein [Pseudomonadota bacterium]